MCQVLNYLCSAASVWPSSLGPHDHCLPGSSVHGILQAGLLEWIAVSLSRGSFRPRDGTWVSRFAGRFFYHWPPPPGSPLYYLDSNPFFGHTPTLPWQGVKPRSPQWNREVLITGSPGNSLESLIKKTSVNYIRAIWVEFIQCLTLYKIAQGNNFSDTSEKLLWRCEAGARIYEFFCCEKTCSRSPKMSVNHRTGKSG